MARFSNKRSKPSSFRQLITWSLLIASVFSAGLIAGYQLSSDSGVSPDKARTPEPKQPPPKSTTESESLKDNDIEDIDYSFFDHLSRKASEKTFDDFNESVSSKETDKSQKETPESKNILRYQLQVAAFADLDRARNRQNKLEEKGLQVELISDKLSGGGRYYRLLVGKFNNIEGARHFQKKLLDREIQTFIVPLR